METEIVDAIMTAYECASYGRAAFSAYRILTSKTLTDLEKGAGIVYIAAKEFLSDGLERLIGD